jgi:hypothetical protein
VVDWAKPLRDFWGFGEEAAQKQLDAFMKVSADASPWSVFGVCLG